MEEVRIAFEQGDFDGALIELDADGKGQAKLPYLFERGLIAHYGNLFDEKQPPPSILPRSPQMTCIPKASHGKPSH